MLRLTGLTAIAIAATSQALAHHEASSAGGIAFVDGHAHGTALTATADLFSGGAGILAAAVLLFLAGLVLRRSGRSR